MISGYVMVSHIEWYGSWLMYHGLVYHSILFGKYAICILYGMWYLYSIFQDISQRLGGMVND